MKTTDKEFTPLQFILDNKPQIAPILRKDENTERTIWNRFIQPIVDLHKLCDLPGKQFQYRFFPQPEEIIPEHQIHLMLRKTITLCQPFLPGKDPADLLTLEDNSDIFHDMVVRRLSSGMVTTAGRGGNNNQS